LFLQINFKTRASEPYDRDSHRRMVAGKMSAFRNKIPFNLEMAKISQELADTMLREENPLNTDPLKDVSRDIYADYMLFLMEEQPTLAAFILAPLSNYGDVFDLDDPTRFVALH
jgi:hypothetical protein